MSERTFIALLRGINVSGQKIIKMEQLRASLARLGYSEVETYIQSGNIIFRTKEKALTVLGKQIAKKIADDFGYDVPVIIKTPEGLARTIKNNPLLQQMGIDSTKMHVSFISEAPPKDTHLALEKLAIAPEQLFLSNSEIYLYCPNGYGKSKLTNVALEKVVAVNVTTRNWNTVNKLYELASK